jgi:hypothetical protein
VVIRLTASASLVMACMLLTGSGAAFADDGIGLSSDGRTWHSTLSSPLFEPEFRWVPGDVETRSFHVRNQGPTGARLTVRVVTRDPDRLVRDDGFDIAARVGGSGWLSLTNGELAEALARELVERGDRVRVDVRVTLGPGATNRSQADTLPFNLRVTLADSHPAPGGQGAGTPSVLPGTGTPVHTGLVWIGSALVGTGLALMAGRRRTPAEGEVAARG